MSTFKPIAPIEPDEFDPDAYEAMIAAIERMTGKTSNVVLQEAFNPDQARYPKGHPRAGQWRPKLSTGAGRIAPGHLANDLFHLNENIKAISNAYGANPPLDRLNDVGKEVEKVALRYSARKHYEKRLADVRKERRQIQDRRWEAWEKAWAGMTSEQKNNSEPDDFLEPGGRKRLAEIADEEIRLTRERDRADRDAMLGVLEKIRPMGGTLREAAGASYAVDQASGIERQYIEAGDLFLGPHDKAPGLARRAMKDDLDKSLKEILKVVPKAWLDDTNSKGEVSWLFSKDRAYADTRATEAKPPTDSFRAMENGVDQALRGELPLARVDQAVSAAMEAEGDPFPHKAPEQETIDAWRERREKRVQELARQRYKWVGRALTRNADTYPDGLWAVVHGQDDGRDYYLDWGGNLHLLDAPQGHSGVEGDVIRKPRDDRRIKGPVPITQAQQDAIERAIASGGSYEGMFKGNYPVVRREGTTEGGIGPYAPIYDWINESGARRNIVADDASDIANWDREAPRPPVLASTQDTIIKIDPSNRPTLLHELSHRLEVVYGTENKAGYNPLAMATHAWRDKRTRGEVLQSLQLLYPGYAYEAHEYAKPDKFVDAYIGKEYPHQSTEVLTMGMEMLWFPRYGERDINKDPEMRQLILGIMATL